MKAYDDDRDNKIEHKMTASEMRRKKRRKERLLREILEYLLTFFIVALAVLALNRFALINARIPSGSMADTISENDQIFGSRFAYNKTDPQRFDIIIFRYPDDPSKLFIKRIIGLPGEKVEVRDGKVYINDAAEPLDDSFTPERPEGDAGPYFVPENCYFVMGDNRNHSNDSRFWENKFVDRKAILGKGLFRYWPPDKMGRIS